MSEVFQNDPFCIRVNNELYINDPFPVEVDHELYINDPFPVEVDHSLPWVVWSDPFCITVDHGIPNFFSSIKNNGIPTYNEKNAYFAVSAFLQLPDLGEEIKLTRNLFSGSWLKRDFNVPITAGFVLSNIDRRFTKSTGDFAGLLSPGIYSPSRKTRKFIKFIVYIFDGEGELICTKYYPRLVIKERTGGIELNFTLIDEISHYLNETIDLPTYAAREILTRDIDNKKFYAYYLTKKFNRFYNSELLRNCEQVADSEFTFTRGESYDTYEFGSEVDEHLPVEAVCPLYVGETIRDICEKVVELQPDVVTKEHFSVICNFQDWQTRVSIPVQNTTALSVIKPLIDTIPGEYWIKPGENNLSLVIQETVNVLDYPETPKYTFTPRNSRGDFGVSYSSIKAFNKMNVIKPNEVSTAYRQIAGSVDGGEQGG